jgi:hypothetical protein
MVEFIGIGVVGGITASLAGWIAYQLRQARKADRFIMELRAQDPFYVGSEWSRIDFQWGVAGEVVPKWQKCILFIGHKRLAIYPYPPKLDSQPIVSIDTQELRGFWRPMVYQDGKNEVWIHAESVQHWGILKIRAWKEVMQAIIRAMKAVSTEQQVKAYRRSRPYPHLGPSPVLPAKQSLTGEWELFNAVDLYLMPLHLVILKEGIIQRVLHIKAIQNIAALKRMEGGEPVGIVRFVHDEENFAFATNDYEAWASAIAEAAKRSLEEPVMQKQKSKGDDWDDVDIASE